MTAPARSARQRWLAPTQGFWLWYATLAGIGLWLAHLTALSALARSACARPGVEWAMHAITAVLLAATGLAAYMSAQLVRGHPGVDDHDPQLAGRLRFMGLFGLLTEAISIMLILWEGLYVPVIDACR